MPPTTCVESEDTIAALQPPTRSTMSSSSAAVPRKRACEAFAVGSRQGRDDLAAADPIILAIALGALVAAGFPWCSPSPASSRRWRMVSIPSQLFPLDSNVDPLILLIGLAVGVDYSLFYMRREREERPQRRAARVAAGAAATSGRAVMISAITVMIAMSGMFITGDATFESFAVATVNVVAIEMLVSLIVLPAVLAWLGDRIEKGRIPFSGRLRRSGESRACGARSSAPSCAGHCSQPRWPRPSCSRSRSRR